MAKIDAAELVHEFLKTQASVYDLVVGGAAGILEAGDLTASVLSSAEATRRAAGNMNLALALSVQDAGEDPFGGGVYAQWVVVRAYDRLRGNRNIRVVRNALKLVLCGFFSNFVAASGRGLLEMTYTGRTGHRYDTVFAVEYEAVTFKATVKELELD